MAHPRPLTQTDPARLDWSRPNTPAATEFGDIYFSIDGGLDETRDVFLKGCGLPENWLVRQRFTIAELGFGSGLNFLAAWQLWDQTATPHQRLHFVSIEKFPLDYSQLQRALSAWPELSTYSEALLRVWPGRVKGFHRLEFGSVTLTLVHEDVNHALEQLGELAANAWFLDGFSPSGNPAMWSETVMSGVAKCCAAGARLASFTVAGAVRSALKKAGFEVRKMPGFGRKRHRLEADYKGGCGTKSQEVDRALIVGAGIAGRSLARSLDRRGIRFDIIDDAAHPAASGNPAALVKPRFDLQDRPESRFFLSAYLHALRAYPQAAVIDRGVRQIPKTQKETERFKKLIEQVSLGEGHLAWRDEALWIDSALVIDPTKIFDNFEVKRGSFSAATNTDAYSHIFLAAGYGIRQLNQDIPLRFSRGQLSWAEPIWSMPTAYGGYAINLGRAALIGATHDRLGAGDPFDLRAEDDFKNYQALQEISLKAVTPFPAASRASVRVTTADTLPLLIKTGPKTWVLTGLGSRGFTFAPLLAEALIADICAEVSPLDKALLEKLSAPR